MAAASGGVNTSVAAAGQTTTANGLVVSIGLEKYIGRAQQALQATLPLVSAMEKLTRTARTMSDVTANSLKIEPSKVSNVQAGLKSVQTESSSVIDRFSRLAGSSSVVVTRLLTLGAVVATVAKWKATLSGNSAGAAQGMGAVANAAGVMAGRITPAAGALNIFSGLTKSLPPGLRGAGSSALAAGVGLGVLSGGLGPVSAGVALLKLGLGGIPGKMGAVVTATGAMLASFGAAKVAISLLTALATGLFAVLVTAAPAMTFGVKLAAESQQAQIAFEVMLGSAKRANQVLAEIRTFAIKTPFGESELIGSARALLAFGESARNVVPALQRIGDVSSGIGAPIGEIAEIYGKARVQGRLFAQDMNQLTGRGISMYSELAKQFGTTGDKVRELVSDGVVEFRHLEQAFVSLTSAGGDFFQLTEKQSRSLAGQWSTFKDSVAASLRRVGEEFIKTGVLSRAMESGAKVAQIVEPALVSLGNVTAWLADRAVSVANGFVWFVNVVQGAASSTSSLAYAMARVGAAMTAVAAAIFVVVAAQKAYVAAQTLALALSGTKGITQLAIGLGAATAAYYALKSITGEVEQATADARKEAEKLSGVKPAKFVSADQLANISVAEEYLKKNRTAAEQLQHELLKIKIAFNDNRSVGQMRAEKGAIDDKTNVYSDIARMNDELDILSGKATEAEVKVRNLMKAGVPDWLANHAGGLMNRIAEQKAANEMIEEQQRKAKQREEQIAREMEQKRDQELKRRKDRAKDIVEANKTPYQKLQDQLKETAALVKSGDLTKSEALKANKRLIVDFASGKRDGKDNNSVQANTEEAMKSIIAAITMRDPQAKVEDLLQSIDAGTFQQNATLSSLGDKFENGWKKVKKAVIQKG